MKNNWKTYVSVVAVLIAILIFVPGRQYLGPVRFRVFRDLFAIGFGLLCVFRNEDAARSAAQPQKWFFRKDTSDAIPLYRWGYLVFGSVFAIGAVVDLLAALRSGL
jgi:hypothetical protein